MVFLVGAREVYTPRALFGDRRRAWSTIKMTTDGKEKVNQLSSGLVHRSKTRSDGNELVTEWSIERDGKTSVRGMDRRSLSADGEELIDDRTIAVSFAEQHFRIVWVKNE